MEDTPGDPNIPNEVAIAAEAIKRKRREDIPELLEGLAKMHEVDIEFSWPGSTARPDHKVIPREWDTVRSLRARAALFREAAAIIRGDHPPVASGVRVENYGVQGSVADKMRAELIKDGWPADKIGTVHPVKGRKRDHADDENLSSGEADDWWGVR